MIIYDDEESTWRVIKVGGFCFFFYSLEVFFYELFKEVFDYK